MNQKISLSLLFMLILIIFVALGCSNDKASPVIPSQETDSIPEIASSGISDLYGHAPLGFWSLYFDADNLTYQIVNDREMNFHFNITSMVPTPQIHINSYDPGTKILNVDVTLHNPYTIEGYDVRAIIFYYASNAPFLTNDDGWTGLYDIAGGEAFNPFRAYARTIGNRKFGALGIFTEKLLIYMPTTSQPVRFAIDASYPSNCLEPYMMLNFRHDSLRDEVGATAKVYMDVYDWQNDISSVKVRIPQVSGAGEISLSYQGGNTWMGTVPNALGAPAGQYITIFSALSSGASTIPLYEVEKITVSTEINWPATWGGSDSDYGYSIKTDSFGNVYIVGGFMNSIDVDPGPGTFYIWTVGGQDTFIVKLNSDGIFQWAKAWGGSSGNDEAVGVTVDLNGNVYVTGYFNGIVDFNPGTGTEQYTSIGMDDVFLSKFNSSGDLIWARTWGSTSYDRGNSVVADGNGNVIVAGYFSGTTDFDPGVNEYIRNANGIYRDAFISKFNSSGTFQWAGTWGALSWDEAMDLACNSNNDIYVVGYFDGTVDFDPDPINSVEYSSVNYEDAFLSKFNSSGVFQWTGTWGGIMTDIAYGVALAGNIRVYVCGEFFDSVDFNPGAGEWIRNSGVGSDGFINAFEPSGNHLAAITWGGGGTVMPLDMLIDSNDKICVAGRFIGNADFDPGAGQDLHSSSSLFDADSFYSRFTLQHVYEFVRVWGSVPYEEAKSISSDLNGNLYITGYFQSTVDFDPGTNVVNRTSNGSSDVFISKFDTNGTFVTLR